MTAAREKAARTALQKGLKSCLGLLSDQAMVFIAGAETAELGNSPYIHADFKLPDGTRLDVSLHLRIEPGRDFAPVRLRLEGPKG